MKFECFIPFQNWKNPLNYVGFPGNSAGKESACNAGDPGLIPGEGTSYPRQFSWASLVAQMVKNPSAIQETWIWSLSWEDSLKKGQATHSSILVWRIPWRGESGRLQSMGHKRVRHDWANFSFTVAAAAAKLLQSCLTLCDSIYSSSPGSTVLGILQARTLEWVAISFSNARKWKVKSLSRVRLFATPWTTAYQAPPSMGLFRQEYWSRLPLPSPFTLELLPKLKWGHFLNSICKGEKQI